MEKILPIYYVEFCSDGYTETYWHHTKDEALKHLEIFANDSIYDNSYLYDYIRVGNYETGEILAEIRF